MPGAPGGYHPQAKAFDAAFVAALERRDWPGAVAAEHRHEAGEDVVDSTRVANSECSEFNNTFFFFQLCELTNTPCCLGCDGVMFPGVPNIVYECGSPPASATWECCS